MTTKQAIEALDSMQSQIIHGKRTFGDISDILKRADLALDEAEAATGNEGVKYSLAERINWLAETRNYFMRQTDQLREELKRAAI